MDEFDQRRIGDEHLMQPRADETLDFSDGRKKRTRFLRGDRETPEKGLEGKGGKKSEMYVRMSVNDPEIGGMIIRDNPFTSLTTQAGFVLQPSLARQ